MRASSLILVALAITLTVTACGRRSAPVYTEPDGTTPPANSYPPPYGVLINPS